MKEKSSRFHWHNCMPLSNLAENASKAPRPHCLFTQRFPRPHQNSRIRWYKITLRLLSHLRMRMEQTDAPSMFVAFSASRHFRIKLWSSRQFTRNTREKHGKINRKTPEIRNTSSNLLCGRTDDQAEFLLRVTNEYDKYVSLSRQAINLESKESTSASMLPAILDLSLFQGDTEKVRVLW